MSKAVVPDRPDPLGRYENEPTFRATVDAMRGGRDAALPTRAQAEQAAQLLERLDAQGYAIRQVQPAVGQTWVDRRGVTLTVVELDESGHAVVEFRPHGAGPGDVRPLRRARIPVDRLRSERGFHIVP